MAYLELSDIMEHAAEHRSLFIFLTPSEPACRNIVKQGNIHAVRVGKIVIIAHIVDHVESVASASGSLDKIERLDKKLLGVERNAPFDHFIQLELEVLGCFVKFTLIILKFLGILYSFRI